MNANNQELKVKTDYKMSRHFNGIVFSVITLLIVIVLVLLFLFYKAQNKIAPPALKTTSAVALRFTLCLREDHHRDQGISPAVAFHGEQS